MDPRRRHVPPSSYLNEESSPAELVSDATWRAVLVRDDLARAGSDLTSDMLMIVDVLNLLARKVEDA
ncbi:MAG TPA: hypothetical protein VH479_19460 [Acidimicrobiales bacterium]|jgi:hypothetical protein